MEEGREEAVGNGLRRGRDGENLYKTIYSSTELSYGSACICPTGRTEWRLCVHSSTTTQRTITLRGSLSACLSGAERQGEV